MDYDNFGEPRSFSAKLKEPYNKHRNRIVPQSAQPRTGQPLEHE